MGRQRPGLWRLAGLAAARFVNQPYARYVLPFPGRQQLLRLALYSALAHGWRCGPRGTAVCGTKDAPGHKRRLRATTLWATAGCGALVVWLIWLWAWSFIGFPEVPALTIILLFIGALVVAWRGHKVNRAKSDLPRHDDLLKLARHGSYPEVTGNFEVHSVASVESGAGRELLLCVGREADNNGWALSLDAANDRLRDYYAELGWQAVGSPATMPFGERLTRMVRLPSPPGATEGPRP